jgi:hypothetical protein
MGSGAPGNATPGVGVPSVPAGTEPFASFEADYVAAQCATDVRCNELPSTEGCIAATLPLFPADLATDTASGVVQYDEGLGYRCIQLLQREPCLGSGLGPAGEADLESCHDAFTGTLAGGQACTFDAECVSGNCVMAACANACCPGVCAMGTEARNVPSGGPCAGSGCVEGDYCDTSGGSPGMCAPRPGEGASCKTTLCEQGLVCGNVSGTCKLPAAIGASCTDDPCPNGETCTSPAGVCSAPPAIGDACTGGTCGLAYNCVGGQCVMPGALGQPCVGPEGSNQCQEGLLYLHTTLPVACQNGVCTSVTPDPVSLSCLSP